LGNEYRPEVQQFIHEFTPHPKHLETLLIRAGTYLPHILEQVERHGLPTEVALLPAIESSWRPEAVSVSAAEGLWQFIPKTGVAYGLIDHVQGEDRRQDPAASTKAALRLLGDLHAQHGDWLLALAAYNAGGQKLQEAMSRVRSRNFWRLPLPQQTRDYVPRLLALAAIVRRPQHYGIKLPTTQQRQTLPVITRRTTSVPTEKRRMWKAMSPPLPSPHPLGSPQKLLSRLRFSGELTVSSRAQLPIMVRPGEEDLSVYVTEEGETLESVARRFGLSIAELSALNPAVEHSPLRTGQQLLLAACSSSGC
jgi:membrane-bound lytic murein transglycosylase D